MDECKNLERLNFAAIQLHITTLVKTSGPSTPKTENRFSDKLKSYWTPGKLYFVRKRNLFYMSGVAGKKQRSIPIKKPENDPFSVMPSNFFKLLATEMQHMNLKPDKILFKNLYRNDRLVTTIFPIESFATRANHLQLTYLNFITRIATLSDFHTHKKDPTKNLAITKPNGTTLIFSYK